MKRAPALASLLLPLGLLAAPPPNPCPALPDVPCRPTGKDAKSAREVSCTRSRGAGEARTFADESAFCLSCHEKDRERNGKGHGKSGPSSHPVGTPYPPPGLPGYRPAGSLDARVRLDGGTIACRTCHGGAEAARLHLSIPSPANGLCTACHLK